MLATLRRAIVQSHQRPARGTVQEQKRASKKRQKTQHHRKILDDALIFLHHHRHHLAFLLLVLGIAGPRTVIITSYSSTASKFSSHKKYIAFSS